MLAPQHGARPGGWHQGGLLVVGFLLGGIVSSYGRARSGQSRAETARAEDAGTLRRRQEGGVAAPEMPPRQPIHSKLHPCTPPSVPAQPSLASYRRLQKNPGLAVKDKALLAEFEAAPWLLPPRSRALPYTGVHDLGKLLKMRSRPAGEHEKSVALLLFNRDWAVMAQNSIYSLVKHGGVQNYIAVTWTARDLEACADLNLPCADVADLLVQPIREKPLSTDFVVMSWIKPAVVLKALQLGHVVMVADTDISYTVKPLWDSYLAFIEQAGADGAWLEEKPASNTGHFVVLPTKAGTAFAKAWSAAGPQMIREGQTDQRALPGLEGESYQRCNTLCRCLRADYNLTEAGRRDDLALFRTYLPGHYIYSPNWCTIGSPQWVPRIDPCDWHVLYLHPICESQPAAKQAVLQAAGFWFIDDPQGCLEQGASKVPSCRPFQWRDANAEASHYSCSSYGLGLVHGGEPAGLQAVRSGATAHSRKAAEELFDLIADKKC